MSLFGVNSLPVAATLTVKGIDKDEASVEYILNAASNLWIQYYFEEEAGVTSLQISLDFSSVSYRDEEYFVAFQKNLEKRVAEKNAEILRLVYHLTEIKNKGL